MTLMRMKSLLVTAVGSLLCVASACGQPERLAVYSRVAHFDGTLSVLTYNVKGSAWPIAWGRPAALSQIAARLQDLRRHGRNPQIVVLQEAFTDDARSIGGQAGYRFVVDGPDAIHVSDVPMNADDRRFVEAASWWRGETEGKMVGSGLQILSDYPILRIRRLAFPAFACAGYDCLANKGALLVTVRVPGWAAPVDIVTTHLNSRHSSGVSDARSLYAYGRQLALLTAFINRWHDPALPLIAAGDFNAGQAPPRRRALNAVLPAWRGASPIREALHEVSRNSAAIPGSVAAVIRHGADWAFFASGAGVRLSPEAIHVPFGPDAAGHMLSDHIGYVAQFRLVAQGHPRLAPGR
jgi:endonuclease/exonuclease/phosphatase family metal-dependent hydrolase